jgi:Nucleoside-diphosphate-sugar pyrophosphorylase involved in lipopolysaccharide biosynthesis/translation initiation factor 2B, gamma/epsilon subunits (eIF-2Bgamma/eIF-2Bepsilon)
MINTSKLNLFKGIAGGKAPTADPHIYLDTSRSKRIDGKLLFRVVALKDLDFKVDGKAVNVKAGTRGGYVEFQSNLGEDSWIGSDVVVHGKITKILNKTYLSGDALITNGSIVRGPKIILRGKPKIDGSWIDGEDLSVTIENATIKDSILGFGDRDGQIIITGKKTTIMSSKILTRCQVLKGNATIKSTVIEDAVKGNSVYIFDNPKIQNSVLSHSVLVGGKADINYVILGDAATLSGEVLVVGDPKYPIELGGDTSLGGKEKLCSIKERKSLEGQRKGVEEREKLASRSGIF